MVDILLPPNFLYVLMYFSYTCGAESVSENISCKDKITSYKVYDSPDAPHHYLNSEGLISYNSVHIDEQGINDGPNLNQVGTAEADLTAVSNRAYEIEVNEERSRIRIIHPDYIYKFVQLYYSLINKNAS